ncbi:MULTISPECIES: NADH:flavin oxidoreductase/NADH oxidase [unclassified Sphingomonas]|nr:MULTISPECIES: NADH:flavin oxidoreductase/NADH oxidase [unclassified Sphingomonas]KQX23222.1 NADH:flavin oxidoreductase / NADH oxidase [Sphingomonas sp. Root1294]KQY68070.1 NADH:flavin oxidoreductase / NADH oxidase [Sphingomonas sp. Root50]KRB90961.1 NADH:flavin oxidoreductase / NADH oxidase [Sphingomonas sp. Root720]
MAVKLLERWRLRDVTVRNRIMISPMCQYSARGDGKVMDWHLAHYGRFAIGGAGLVMTEATAVVPEGRLSHGDLGLWSDDHVPGLARLAELITSQGAVPGLQLGHAGRKAGMRRPWHGDGAVDAADLAERGEAPWPTVSVSGAPAAENLPAPRMLRLDEIPALLDSWRAAARRALEAGFRIIEIHAAHGYLINCFLSPLSNKRSDAYGGDRINRMRLAIEIVRAVRSVWPESLPLFCRISAIDAAADGWNLDDSVQLAIAMRAAGVDVIDCSSGGIGGDLSVIPRGPGFQVPFAQRIREEAGIATVAVGLIVGAQQAADVIDQGRADIVAIGREALFNPNWPLHAAMQLQPERRFEDWPPQSGWWLGRRKTPHIPFPEPVPDPA